MTPPRIVAVVGPTASGKSALAVELAKRFGGEIVSCDSMQIYRGMDIGTAKPSPAEMEGIPHHLIDVVDPAEPFSAADYAPLAKAAIDDILARGRLPILCGGTGLYLDAVITANQYADTDTDPSLRASLLADAERYGADDLWKRLYAVDPQSAAEIHPNNVKRVARALEIYLSSGIPKSEWDRRSRSHPRPYDVTLLAIEHPDRQTLYDRIDRRVTVMAEMGLVDEVRSLLESGRLPRNSTAAQAIGYKEIIAHLDGDCTEAEALDAIRLNSRRYAKRQLTWFRRNSDINWLIADANFEVIVNNAEKLLTKRGFCAIM
ncbi:MAG: tRNA (adenosine(37)-N6)-dimethylallyltransferase MiaA [Clostridia bacterium]|nr:tRNA (adenosine(37)-N6)-dimethylallyltransferase MiaA [Clostridia bacterium]